MPPPYEGGGEGEVRTAIYAQKNSTLFVVGRNSLRPREFPPERKPNYLFVALGPDALAEVALGDALKAEACPQRVFGRFDLDKVFLRPRRAVRAEMPPL